MHIRDPPIPFDYFIDVLITTLKGSEFGFYLFAKALCVPAFKTRGSEPNSGSPKIYIYKKGFQKGGGTLLVLKNVGVIWKIRGSRAPWDFEL